MRRLLPWLSIAVLAAAGAWAHERTDGLGRVEPPSAVVEVAVGEEPSLTLRGWNAAGEASADASGPEPSAPGEDPDADVQELVEEVICEPPDPLETGTSTLAVQVTDEAGATPESLDLQLWRLGAPANEHWLAGDRCQASARVEGGHIQWTGLPAGLYRLFSPDLRKGAEDPAAFELAGTFTFLTVALTLPRRVPVVVRVIDETGAPIVSANRCAFGFSGPDRETAPSWVVARKPRREPNCWWTDCCCGHSNCSEEPSLLEAAGDGFELGACAEPTRAGSTSRTEQLLFEGRTYVFASVDGEDVAVPHALRYVAVSVPLEHVTAHVWTPDGRSACEAGARFYARCEAVRVPEGQAAPARDQLPIQVDVILKGHERLSFVVHLGECPTNRTLCRVIDPELPAR